MPSTRRWRSLSSILESEPSGRLYKALVESKDGHAGLCRALRHHDPGTIEIVASVNTKDPATLEKVRDAMLLVIDDVARSGVTKRKWIAPARSSSRTASWPPPIPTASPSSSRSGAPRATGGSISSTATAIEQVTPAQVKEIAEKYFGTSNRTVGYFIPTAKAERTPIPAGARYRQARRRLYRAHSQGRIQRDRRRRPLAIEARVQRPEPIGGSQAGLPPQENPRRVGCIFSLTLHYGNAGNLKGLNEAAGFLRQLMTRETKSLNRQQIQDALDKNFARLGRRHGGRGMTRGAAEAAVWAALPSWCQTRRAIFAAVLESFARSSGSRPCRRASSTLSRTGGSPRSEQGRSDPRSPGYDLLQPLLSHIPSDDVRYVPTVDEHVDRIKEASLEQVQVALSTIILGLNTASS